MNSCASWMNDSPIPNLVNVNGALDDFGSSKQVYVYLIPDWFYSTYISSAGQSAWTRLTGMSEMLKEWDRKVKL